MEGEQKITFPVQVNHNTALLYKPGFDLSIFRPNVGDVFRIFIPERFFLLTNSAIVDRTICGTTFYTPDSDIVNIALHSGCMFPHPKSTGYSRRWCTISNFYEAICNEDKYAKIAEIMEIPPSVQVQGLLVDILIDNTLRSYQSSNRNGLKSKTHTGIMDYSMRVASFKILTKFDKLPRIVSEFEYTRQYAKIPIFKFAFNREIGVEFSPDLFLSIFSISNIQNDLFTIYKLFFDVGSNRYEIHYNEDTNLFSLTLLQSPIDIKDYKVRRSKKPTETVIEQDLSFFDIVATPKGLKINGSRYEPIDTLLVSMFVGKILVNNNKFKG